MLAGMVASDRMLTHGGSVGGFGLIWFGFDVVARMVASDRMLTHGGSVGLTMLRDI
jgi:hypothetical protein